MISSNKNFNKKFNRDLKKWWFISYLKTAQTTLHRTHYIY